MTVRVALAGAGRFGALHLRVLSTLPVEVVAACDPDDARLASVRDELGVPRTYPDLGELLAHEHVDLVDVTSDESTHDTLVSQALAAGCHVFVEKPLAMSAAEADTIRTLADDSGLSVVTGQVSRFAAGYQHLHDAVTSGELGTLVNLRFRRDFSRSWFPAFGQRVHPVWESGIHDIDLAVWYARSPARSVYAVERNISGHTHPDTFVAVVTFESGVVATLESAWLVPDAAPQTLRGTLELDGTIDATAEVLGDSGTATYRLAHDGMSVRTDRTVAHPELTLWPTIGGRVGGALAAELSYAVEVASGRRVNDIMPLGDAVEGVRVAEAIVRAGAVGVAVSV